MGAKPEKAVIRSVAAHLNNNAPERLNRTIELVRELNRHINAQEILSYCDIREKVNEITKNIYIKRVNIAGGTDLVRAVKYDKSTGNTFENVSRLSYIPKETPITPRQGRLNLHGQAMYYGSIIMRGHELTSSLESVLSECNASGGDIFNILYSKVNSISVSGMGVDLIPVGVNNYMRKGIRTPYHMPEDLWKTYHAIKPKLSEEGRLALHLSDAFLADVLSRPHEDEDQLYDVTSAIGDVLLQSSADGIIYPSVAYAGYPNVVLKPKAVDFKVKHKRTESILVDKCIGHGLYKLKSLNKGNVHRGQIEWFK
ncbi:RES family NAD+ phosphorylase [Vibrio coralliilyticus]|uniref:RES family NAD+ phosphorylase n=1 Tax=Vibrio coralliilyticus TaxID=190893 RepID=UPI0005127A0B|nr:RES family NAD+ phosphorylase [Vibrio coralliilyticus]AIU67960.1 hypothetical protein JV59_37695 [Vibrio coralliilyticus]